MDKPRYAFLTQNDNNKMVVCRKTAVMIHATMLPEGHTVDVVVERIGNHDRIIFKINRKWADQIHSKKGIGSWLNLTAFIKEHLKSIDLDDLQTICLKKQPSKKFCSQVATKDSFEIWKQKQLHRIKSKQLISLMEEKKLVVMQLLVTVFRDRAILVRSKTGGLRVTYLGENAHCLKNALNKLHQMKLSNRAATKKECLKIPRDFLSEMYHLRQLAEDGLSNEELMSDYTPVPRSMYDWTEIYMPSADHHDQMPNQTRHCHKTKEVVVNSRSPTHDSVGHMRGFGMLNAPYVGTTKSTAKVVSFEQMMTYLEDQASSLENYFQMGRTNRDIFKKDHSITSEASVKYKEQHIQVVNIGLFTLVKKFDKQFALIFASLDLEQLVSISEKIAILGERNLVDSIEVKISINLYNAKCKDIFRMTEPTQKVAFKDLFERIGYDKIDSSLYFALKNKLMTFSMPKVYLQRLIKLVDPIFEVSRDGLSIANLGSVISSMQSLALSPSCTRSPRNRNRPVSPNTKFVVTSRLANRTYDTGRLIGEHHAYDRPVKLEKLETALPLVHFMTEMRTMHDFYKYRFRQSGNTFELIVRLIQPQSVFHKVFIEVKTYK